MLKLRDYQEQAVDRTLTHLTTKTTNPLIVLPTGAGKSVVISELVNRVGVKTLLLAHRAELLKQNGALISGGSVSFYSASLGEKDLSGQVVVAGIQSIARSTDEQLANFKLVIIDEVHRLPPDGEGQYRTLLSKLSPEARVVGLTATPFRLSTGSLIGNGQLFDEISYTADLISLQRAGYLSPILSKIPKHSPKHEALEVRSGEFTGASLEAVYGSDMVTNSTVRDLLTQAANRKSVIIFCATKIHAEKVTSTLKAKGEAVELILSDTMPMLRADFIDQFKKGRLRFLVSVDIFTEGFDAPNVDCVVLARSTMSPGLFCQMVGRGLRLSPATGKTDCLLLDYGRNLELHGPIDQVRVVKKMVRDSKTGKFEEKSEVIGTKLKGCPTCEAPLPARATSCSSCGFIFPSGAALHNHEQLPVTSDQEAEWEIVFCRVVRHRKEGSPDMVKIEYHKDQFGPPVLSEFLCFDHGGFAAQKAVARWRKQVKPGHQCATRTDQALRSITTLRPVERVAAKKDGKYWRVTKLKFGGEGKVLGEHDSIFGSEPELDNYDLGQFDNYDDVPF